ncbi:MAG: GTPase HflX, partial [Thermoleophilia bacterium]
VSEERLEEMVGAVEAVLVEIGADAVPVELVLNKIDAVDAVARRRLANRYPGALQVSALTGEGLDALQARIAERFQDRYRLVELLVPYAEGGALSQLYALGPPIERREDRPEGVLIQARLPERELGRFASYLVDEDERVPARSRG